MCCMSCGCLEPSNDHGSEDNITMDDLEAAAESADITPEQAAQNIVDAVSPKQKSLLLAAALIVVGRRQQV